VRVDANLQGTQVEEAFAALVDRLLLGDLLPAGEPSLEGTRSLSARRAYLRGEVALDAWRLEVADSAFVEATERDTDYAAAQLRTALARQWRGVPATGWVVPAHQAEQRRHDLSPRDQEAARALVAEADGDLATACTIWRELTRSEDQDYAAWYGWARCQAADDAVVAEAGSPSGWAFRTSYHAALEAYQRAFRLNPSILTSYREESYAPLLGLFRLRSDVTRRGRTAPPDSRTFWADASWRGDSLAYVPYPDDSGSYALGSRSPDLDEAIRHLKETFRGLASAWVAASPRNADAHQALALAMAMMGDPSAIAILRTARDLAIDEAHRLEIMGWMAGMELALSVPADRGGVRRARAMADSVLQTGRDAAVSDRVLGSLAALTGRADLAVSYVTDPDASSSVFAAPLRRDAPALLVYAALGGPADSLAALERRVVTTIRDALLPTEQARALHEFLIRPATLAYPSHRLAAFDSLTDVDDYLWDLQAAWSSHDSVRVRQGLDRLRADRLQLLPGSITWDALYPEASLLTELGDPRAAADWLDPALNVLPQVVPLILRDAAHAGALARAFALRAVIADQLGDSLGAAHWARVVVTLWGDADPFLQPIVRRLGALAR
jgi:tetratricopeptide (TPR) repeat protein